MRSEEHTSELQSPDNLVTDYGNMVSVSVPFGLAYSLDHGLIKEGAIVYLMGTAAGMTEIGRAHV